MNTKTKLIPQMSDLKKWLFSLLPAIPAEMPRQIPRQLPQRLPRLESEGMPLPQRNCAYAIPDGLWDGQIPLLIPAGMPVVCDW